MVDRLEMPEPLAGPDVERDDAVSEEIGAFPVPSIEVVLGASGRDVDDAALLVDRLLCPVVGAADGFPRVLGPGVVAELAGPRDGVKGPDQCSRADIERPNVAGRRSVLLVRRRAEDDEVLENSSRDVGFAD